MTPPLLRGGQGRSDDDVRSDGVGCAVAMAIAIVVSLLLWLAGAGLLAWVLP